MIAQIDRSSRAILSFYLPFVRLQRTPSAPPAHPQRTPSTPVTDPSTIDPQVISLLDERRYAGQHIHDPAMSSLADE
jgi:hypothetical protein